MLLGFIEALLCISSRPRLWYNTSKITKKDACFLVFLPCLRPVVSCCVFIIVCLHDSAACCCCRKPQTMFFTQEDY